MARNLFALDSYLERSLDINVLSLQELIEFFLHHLTVAVEDIVIPEGGERDKRDDSPRHMFGGSGGQQGTGP